LHQQALGMYEKGLLGDPKSEHDQLCSAGLARMCVRSCIYAPK
jgi:hypothetical protein